MRELVVLTLLALVLAACGNGDPTAVPEEPTTTTEETTTTTQPTTTTTEGTTTTTEAEAEGSTVATADSELGTVLVDGEGLTLYILTADQAGESSCYDQCAQAWPPHLTEGEPRAEGEVDAGLLGTTTRDDGTVQVTYDGWPLYTFVNDLAPGDVNGQGIVSFGGTWWVIGPDGAPIEG